MRCCGPPGRAGVRVHSVYFSWSSHLVPRVIFSPKPSCEMGETHTFTSACMGKSLDGVWLFEKRSPAVDTPPFAKPQVRGSTPPGDRAGDPPADPSKARVILPPNAGDPPSAKTGSPARTAPKPTLPDLEPAANPPDEQPTHHPTSRSSPQPRVIPLQTRVILPRQEGGSPAREGRITRARTEDHPRSHHHQTTTQRAKQPSNRTPDAQQPPHHPNQRRTARRPQPHPDQNSPTSIPNTPPTDGIEPSDTTWYTFRFTRSLPTTSRTRSTSPNIASLIDDR